MRPLSGIITINADGNNNPTCLVGDKQYELINHLGNVMVVVNDKKQGVNVSGSNADAEYYMPDVVSAQDNFAFGGPLPDRKFNTPASDFGFNGKREDVELYGEGNSYDFGARLYDPRLGRFMRPNLARSGWSFESQYAFAGNTLIGVLDKNGKKIYFSCSALTNAKLQEAYKTIDINKTTVCNN